MLDSPRQNRTKNVSFPVSCRCKQRAHIPFKPDGMDLVVDTDLSEQTGGCDNISSPTSTLRSNPTPSPLESKDKLQNAKLISLLLMCHFKHNVSDFQSDKGYH